MPADKLLPALGHAMSGSAGTAISTFTTYPLDLVNTRLKVQRQLRKDGAISSSEQYQGIADAFRRIYAREGGLAALYAGLGSDVAKSIVDSFLFFLFYSWFRSRRLAGRNNARHLPAWEELAVGAASGACARAFTTPISNVVTRKQTASLVDQGVDAGSLSVGEIIHTIRAEKGILGLWSGYAATLVLTLNPSVTFFLQQILEKKLLSRQKWDSAGSGMTFLIAAMSKVVATTVTYPFQIAKARSQVSAPSEPREEEGPSSGEKETLTIDQNTEDQSPPHSPVKAVASGIRHMTEDNIFSSVLKIGRAEGVPALYDGLSGELLKAFFNHGTTMLSKDIVHKFIVQLYFFILSTLRRFPAVQSSLLGKSRELSEKLQGGFRKASTNSSNIVKQGGKYVEDAYDSSETVVLNLLDSTQRKAPR